MSSLFDRVRAWVHGELDERDVEALRAELARDAEAAQFAAEYRELFEATRALDGPAPTSRIDFATLERRIADESRAPRWRKVAAAAALVLAAGATWLAWPRESAPLELHAIALDVAAADSPAPAIPPALATFEPTENGEIRWVPNVDSGLALARAAGRPMLLFGMFPTCPWCQQMKAEGLRDPTVVALFDDVVPVQVDLSLLSESERDELVARGYPLFEIWNDEGAIVHTFAGFHDAPEFVDNLSAGVERALEGARPPAWSALHDDARELDAALANERDGAFGEAQERFTKLEHDASSHALLEAARGGLVRVASAARDALLEAREIATRDRDLAAAELADAARRFAGSPFAADLSAARERLLRDGRFPELTTAR